MTFDVSGFSPSVSGRGFFFEINNRTNYPIWFSVEKVSGGVQVNIDEQPKLSEDEVEKLR